MTTDWFSQIQKSKKSCMVDKNLKKVHFDFGDGKEMVEEYNLDTNVVTRRIWRQNKEIKGEESWEVEVGDPEPIYNAETNSMIRENPNEPVVSRRITKLNLEWRIRNLPYSLNVYSVTADEQNDCLTVRTTNKKYYKKLTIPDLQRLGLKPAQENVSFSHKFNTLIITYRKPKELLQFEKAMLEEVKQIKPKSFGDLECGDVNGCKPS